MGYLQITRVDRVQDTTSTAGTGTLTLDLNAPAGYQNMSAYPTGAQVRYLVANQSLTEWEDGLGTWTTSGSQFTRDLVYASSNGGSLVNFSAGVKNFASVLTAADINDLNQIATFAKMNMMGV